MVLSLSNLLWTVEAGPWSKLQSQTQVDTTAVDLIIGTMCFGCHPSHGLSPM